VDPVAGQNPGSCIIPGMGTTYLVSQKKVTPVSRKIAITPLKINIFEWFKNGFPLS